MKYKTMKLGEVANVTMGQSPKSQFYNQVGQGIEFLQGVRTFGNNYPKYDTYTTEYKKEAHEGDILFSVRAPVGEINWADRTVAIGRGLASIEAKDGYSSKYLYYYLKKIGPRLDSKATGTVFTSINRNELLDIDIIIPENLEDQERLGNRLFILDKKIELNNKINTNLSMQVHVLFQKLISSSKLKKINISELYDIKYGKTLPKSKLSTSGIKVYGANGLIGYTEQESVINKPTVTITSRGSRSGFVSYIDEKNIFLTNNLLYLIDKKNVGLSFTYELLKSCKPQQFVTGSAQPQLTIKNLSQLNINIPDDKKIMDKFIKDTISFEKIIQKNKEENVNLFNLKEILLNKYFNLLN